MRLQNQKDRWITNTEANQGIRANANAGKPHMVTIEFERLLLAGRMP
tara:strand:- start:317 stop:457 length:141 start_codon:yes stop_codon:yes gene_type:complete